MDKPLTHLTESALTEPSGGDMTTGTDSVQNRRGPVRVMIATPTYQSLVSTQYMMSVLRLVSSELTKKYDFAVTPFSDSLVPRTRNELFAAARRLKCDKILFIDSDVAFTSEDVENIISSPQWITAGTYRKHCAEVLLNYNLTKEIEDQIMATKKFEAANTWEAFLYLCETFADPETFLVPARHLPTGFMCIDMRAFPLLEKVAEPYLSDSRSNHLREVTPEIAQELTVHNLFPVIVHKGILLSEDWGFCELCARAGLMVFLDTRIIVPHLKNVGLSVPTRDEMFWRRKQPLEK